MLKGLTGCVVAACALLAPAGASASLPLVGTDGAHATSPTTATVEGNADPNGQKTMLRAYFAPADSKWCTSGGTTGKRSKTAPTKLGAGNNMFSELAVQLNGLRPNERYCAELVAHNASGSAYGGQLVFMTGSE